MLAWLLDGFSIDGAGNALTGRPRSRPADRFVWPALAVVVVPISVLTLGLGAIVLEALVVGIVLDALPGVQSQGFWTAVIIAVGLAVVTTIVQQRLLALDDDAWLTSAPPAGHADVRARRRSATFPASCSCNWMASPRWCSSGPCVPATCRICTVGSATGSHHLVGWTTGWSSQTGVSQCGILHGSTADMPAFRWLDKETREVIVSNHPSSARAIELAHSDGHGLLAHHGSSYGNLFSGDAERAVLTMSGVGRRKEGRLGAGYFGYFSRPQQAARTFLGLVVEIARERRAAGTQRRRDVEPRVPRGWSYSLLRAFTTIISRDVSVEGVINDMCEGRAAIYVDFLGYDEVAHHSGPERVDTLAVLRDLDRQIGRIERTIRWTPRPVPHRRPVRPRPDPGRHVRAARR